MNPWFRNTSSIDALGAVTSTNFDVFGNVTSVVDPLNNTTSYTYNKLQQLVTENKGTDRSFSYDANGNLATLTDRNSRVTTYTYDNRNRLTNESWGGTRTLGYTYDSIDRLTAISDSDSLALDFSFAYDSRSQLQGEIQSGSSYMLGKSFAFDRDYDNVGNQTKLASIIGGALSGTDITGGIKDFANTYTYDYLNRRTSATQSQVSGGNSVAAKHVTTAFNLASQITDVRRYSDTTNSSANLEAHTRHSFDSAGRLKSITHSKTELGAGVNWDGTSSLPSTGTFAAYFLSYDADNRITSLASRADGFVTNFTYDIIDQLTAATTSAISGLSMPFSPTAESYNLDENGNRKSSGCASQSASGTHNRLQTDGTYNYTYDNEGNVTRRTKISDSTVTDYTWDYRNRLATVTDKVSASGATLRQVEYTYDAFDQRTAKRVDTDGNGTWDRYEVYTWADGQEVQRWVDTDGAGTGQKLRLANRYLWAESVDQLLSDEQYASGTGMEVDATTASGTAGTTLWALTDHLGSVRDLLDNNGVVREHNVFDSFGRLIREVDYNSSGTAISSTDAAAVDSIFGYTGRDWDSDIGMQYNRARWYDPQTGRWLSQDPIGFAAGDANLYRYVGNSPTMATDPSGLWQEPVRDDYVESGVREQNESERAAAERNGKKLVLPPLPPFNPYTNLLRAHFIYPFDANGRCWQDGRSGGMPPTPVYVPGQLASGGTKLTIVANKGHVYVIVETPDGHTHSYGAYPGGMGIGNVEVDTDLKWPSHAVNSITYVLSANQEQALANWINTPWTYVNQIVRVNRSVCIDYAEDTMDVVLRADSKIVDGQLGWMGGLTVANVIAEIERRKDYRREFNKRNPPRQPAPAPPIVLPGGGGGKTK